MDELTGQTLGPYQILLKVRESSTNTVYRAYHTDLGRFVALQVILPGVPRPQELTEKFMEFSKILGRLKHPNIGSLLDCAEIDGFLCLVYDFAPRAPLRRRFQRPMEWKAALRMLVPAAQALTYAHSQGVFHGTFQPSAVLYTTEGAPIIFDLGIELLLTQELMQRIPGNWIGSNLSCYLAPEQVAGKAFDYRVDIYAFGMTLYELIVGKRAFQGETKIEEMVAQATQQLTLPGDTAKKLPAIAETILRKTLAADPDSRFKDMKNVSTLLAKMALGQPVHRKMLTNPNWTPPKPISVRVVLATLGFLLLFGLLAAYLVVQFPKMMASQTLMASPTSIPTAQPTAVAAAQKATRAPTSPARTPTKDSPTLIPTPSPAVAMRSEYPYLFDRPVPEPSEPVTSGAVQRLIALSRFGIGWLNDMAWSPEGGQIALATSTGVYILNAETQALETYINTAGAVTSLAYSPDGAQLTTGDEDGLVRLWQVETGQEVRSFSGHSLPIRRVVFSPNGKYIAAVSDGLDGWLWQVDGQAPGVRLAGHVQTLTGIAFSPNSSEIVTASRDFNLKRWILPAGELQATLVGRAPILDAAYTLDGAGLITSDGGGAVLLWSLADGKISEQIGRVNLAASEIELIPDGSAVAAAESNGTVTVFDFGGTKRWSARNEGQPRQIPNAIYTNRIRFSPDGTKLASGIWDNTIRFWDSATGADAGSITRFGDFLARLEVSPDSSILAGQTLNENVKVWDLHKGLLSFTVSGSLTPGRPFSSDSTMLAVRENPATVVIYSVKSGEELYRFGGHSDIRSIAFSKDGKALAAGNFNAFRVWSLPSRQEFDTHTNFAFGGCNVNRSKRESSLAFSTRFHFIDFVQSSKEPVCGMILVGWMQSHTFLVDGAYAAAGGASKLEVWNYIENTKGVDMQGLFGFQVQEVALQYDGSIVAGAVDDGTLRLWDTTTGVELMRVTGQDYGITSMAFTKDGRYLITAALDGTILIWGIP